MAAAVFASFNFCFASTARLVQFHGAAGDGVRDYSQIGERNLGCGIGGKARPSSDASTTLVKNLWPSLSVKAQPGFGTQSRRCLPIGETTLA